MRVVKVALGDRSYSIEFGKNRLQSLGHSCAKLGLGKTCAVISDAQVAPLYGEAVLESLTKAGFQPLLVQVPAGEASKSLRHVQNCYDQLAQHRLERKSFVVALGGGVIGDLAGFVAATYLRGIPFVQVPTTLLAQVDSSVGGKVGVNLRAGKNLVGAFYQPRLVLCDLDVLKSLPTRELRAGLAEVIKYGIIYDARFFRYLEHSIAGLLKRDSACLEKTIARCCAIKAEVVSQDETETGLRAILNYGHTIGHALEAISGYGRYLHGEAISIGQVAAAHLSAAHLGLPSRDVARTIELFKQAGLPIGVRLDRRERTALLNAMRLDKKVSSGEIKFVLARRIGQVEFGQKVTDQAVHDALDKISG